ncbi:hypothetical protein D3C79_300490 [compost metagenome]
MTNSARIITFFLPAPLPPVNLKPMILLSRRYNCITVFQVRSLGWKEAFFIFRMARRSPPKYWATRFCLSSRSRPPPLRCPSLKPKRGPVESANRLTIFIAIPACARWCFIPSFRRKCVMSSPRAKAFARISFRRWSALCRANWTLNPRRCRTAPTG